MANISDEITADHLVLVPANHGISHQVVCRSIPRPLSIISGAAIGEPAAVSAKLEMSDQLNDFILGFGIERAKGGGDKLEMRDTSTLEIVSLFEVGCW